MFTDWRREKDISTVCGTFAIHKKCTDLMHNNLSLRILHHLLKMVTPITES